jgi:phospholipase C
MPEKDQSPQISRRQLIGTGLAGASALALSGAPLSWAGAAEIALNRDGIPKNPAESGIDHIVVVMMENRSFDHMLGWLPGARGRQAGLKYADNDGGKHRTWHLDTFTGEGFNDPNHGFNGGRSEYNDGKCNGWLRTSGNDIYSIGYYTADDLDFYGNAAPYWTVCDHFFASFMGPTFPNRFYMHSAATDRTNNAFTTCTLPTIWGSLADAGLTGRYYFSDLPFTALYGPALVSISSPYADFLTACANGTLANVSFVDPRFRTTPSGIQNDDHPHADIRRGQKFLNDIYTAVTNSPNWPNTVLVIVYDEWGGFFDHIRPNVVPDANPEWGLRGFRIPALVIGPRAKRGHVRHGDFDPTSILKMIEWRWGLPALSPRDASARNLAQTLDFVHPPDLTAPQWVVPDIDGEAAVSARATEDPARDRAQAEEHSAEWERVGEMAVQYGFRV